MLLENLLLLMGRRLRGELGAPENEKKEKIFF
jgi:hypothetical protein